MNWRMILSVWTQLNGLVNWLMCRLYGNVSINNRHPDQCDHAYTHCCRCVKRFVVVLLDRDRRQDINYAQFRRLLKTLLIFSLTGCLLAPWKYLGLIIYYYMFNIITKLWKKNKYWRELEILLWIVQSHWKWRRIALSVTVFKLVAAENIVTLKSTLGVTEGHLKGHHSIDRIEVPIGVP